MELTIIKVVKHRYYIIRGCNIQQFTAHATDIDFARKTLTCEDVYHHYGKGKVSFNLDYDKLIIAVGTKVII